MTSAVTLESKIEQFRDALDYGWNFGDYRYGIPDCHVMIKLGCSPQNWSRYRPHLIQYCEYNDLVKTEVRDGIEMETIKVCMRYDKKKKQGYGKRNPLLIKDEKGLWGEMTTEELEKYNLFSLAEDDFMY